MRAVAKISVLPVLLKATSVDGPEGREEEADTEPADNPRMSDS